MKIVYGVLMILAATVPAALLSWWLLAPLQIGGVLGALLTVFLAMVLAAAFFAAIVALGKALKQVK